MLSQVELTDSDCGSTAHSGVCLLLLSQRELTDFLPQFHFVEKNQEENQQSRPEYSVKDADPNLSHIYLRSVHPNRHKVETKASHHAGQCEYHGCHSILADRVCDLNQIADGASGDLIAASLQRLALDICICDCLCKPGNRAECSRTVGLCKRRTFRFRHGSLLYAPVMEHALIAFLYSLRFTTYPLPAGECAGE